MAFVMELKIVCFWVLYLFFINLIIITGTLERFCQSNGTWAMTISPDIQCKSCIGDGRPVTVNLKKNFSNYFFIFILFSLIQLVLW
jgi:hypothetical protein